MPRRLALAVALIASAIAAQAAQAAAPAPRMHDGPAECPDSAQRRFDVLDLEVRERERVAGTGAAAVHADGRSAAARLPAVALVVGPRFEVDLEQG